ncbi:VOC family protein [Fulvivirga sp. M361]|uniref:VOC family protein n=1 Tax=Fulvivirga sp. M361 TaxID=2594266 RepID=UPI00117BD49D|nr:VOC family protein [Fulvivirga sp. M361]TRX61412.1 VOC family protein [Fulvivirga sp. M361]
MAKTFQGLRTTIYRVSDLPKATAWYAEIFETAPYFNDTFYVGFNIAGYELGLIADEADDVEKTGNVLTYWGVEDVQSIYNKLLSAGAVDYEKPHNVGGEIMVGAVKDPWGNALGIIYNPHFALE